MCCTAVSGHRQLRIGISRYNSKPLEYSLVWTIGERAAGKGMVFWPCCPEQGIQFYLPLSLIGSETCPKQDMVLRAMRRLL